jgi:hypothetical protein
MRECTLKIRQKTCSRARRRAGEAPATPHECWVWELFLKFFDFFQKNPKVPENAAVTRFMRSGKAPSGSRKRVEIIEKYFRGTLKFLRKLP